MKRLNITREELAQRLANHPTRPDDPWRGDPPVDVWMFEEARKYSAPTRKRAVRDPYPWMRREHDPIGWAIALTGIGYWAFRLFKWVTEGEP